MLKRSYKISGGARQSRKYYFLVLALLMPLLSIGSPGASQEHPQKIISFDLCVDQLLLDIVPVENIAAVTFLSRDENYSFYAGKAKAVGVTTGAVEDAFKYQADLVLVGAFETRSKIELLRRLGFRVEVIPLAFEPEFLEVSLATIGEVTGHTQRATEIINKLGADIKQLQQNLLHTAHNTLPRAIHLAARRHTQGANSVVNSLLTLAGYKNIALETGHSDGGYIGLEKLIEAKPDLIVISKDQEKAVSLATDALKHPALRQLLSHTQLLEIHQKYLLCLTPKITEAALSMQNKLKGAKP